ncbi:MAG TPA: hypothetical protein ENK32_04655 [Anaerolineae bacterium]|nr:hypothetical protein [Anaerolineae bacterium]
MEFVADGRYPRRIAPFGVAREKLLDDLLRLFASFDRRNRRREFGGYRFGFYFPKPATPSPLYSTSDGMEHMLNFAGWVYPPGSGGGVDHVNPGGQVNFTWSDGQWLVEFFDDPSAADVDAGREWLAELTGFLARRGFALDSFTHAAVPTQAAGGNGNTTVPAQAAGDGDTAVYVPTRPENFRQWQAVWRLIRRKVEYGETTAKIAAWLQGQENLTDLPASYKTVSKIITAGNAGKLETKP